MNSIIEQELTGQQIVAVRNELNWTQEQLAARTDLSRGTIQAAESGKRGKGPSLKTVNSLKSQPDFYYVFSKLFLEPSEQEFVVKPLKGHDPFEIYRETQHALCNNNYSLIPEEFYFCDDFDIENQVTFQTNGLNEKTLATLRNNMNNFITKASTSIRKIIQKTDIHIVSITCGYGWLEFLLAKLLIEAEICKKLSISILHNSISLLANGFEVASSLWPQSAHTHIQYILGRRKDVHLIENIINSKSTIRTRRLFIAQSSLSNHDESRMLLTSITKLSRKHDLLIIALSETITTNLTKNDIFQQDIRLRDEYLISEDPICRSFVSSSLLKFDQRICGIEFTPEVILEPSRFGSAAGYGVNLELTVHYNNEAPRKVSGHRIYRYIPKQICQILHMLGWALIEEQPCDYDAKSHAPTRWMMFIKT